MRWSDETDHMPKSCYKHRAKTAGLRGSGRSDPATVIMTQEKPQERPMTREGKTMLGNGISGIIFDLDGTLADTSPDIAAALNAALREAGQTPLPVPDVITMIGGGIPTLVVIASTMFIGAVALLVFKMLVGVSREYNQSSFWVRDA